jgi:hypothetical protein
LEEVEITLYVMIIFSSQVYTFIELCTIRMPITAKNAVEFIAEVDKLYMLSVIYQQSCNPSDARLLCRIANKIISLFFIFYNSGVTNT